MMTMARWQIWMILAICAFGVIFAAPNLLPREQAERLPQWLPNQQISLGLDLQGGVSLLLEVDTKVVQRDRLTAVLDDIRTRMRTERIVISGLAASGENAVTFRVREAPQLEQARTIVRDIDKTAQVTTSADGTITTRLDDKEILETRRKAVAQSIEIVRRRVDATGTKEASIQIQGQDRILVQVPGLTDPQRLKKIISETAKMNFHLVDVQNSLADAMAGRVPPGSILVPADSATDSQRMYLLQRRVSVDGANLTDAQPGTNSQSGEWVVNFKFNSKGARDFAEVTRQNVGKPFAIVLDNKVISAPVIREPILAGSGQISGSFNAASATDLSVLLRAGALPAPLKVIEERTVGPELGADSIRAGFYAVGVGLILVVTYMWLAYGLFGLFANVALVFNLILIVAVMSLLQSTLTLPGIAGILLTLGMSVDANVLINERIRDETRVGKTPIASMEAGFARAYSTIVDANLTTLIKMLILFGFGTGPVKGFAITISIGIITSMFTATMLVRFMMSTWLRQRRPKLLPV